jgi:hypothetical protein
LSFQTPTYNARRDSVRLGYDSHSIPNALLKSIAVKSKTHPSLPIIIHHLSRDQRFPPIHYRQIISTITATDHSQTITAKSSPPSPPDHHQLTSSITPPHAPQYHHHEAQACAQVVIRCSQYPRTQLQTHNRPISHRAGYVWVSPRGNTR